MAATAFMIFYLLSIIKEGSSGVVYGVVKTSMEHKNKTKQNTKINCRILVVTYGKEKWEDMSKRRERKELNLLESPKFNRVSLNRKTYKFHCCEREF